MMFTTATLLALVPLAAVAAPALNARENWGKNEDKAKACYADAEHKDWKPIWRSPYDKAKPYHYADNKFDDMYEYTSASKWFNDEDVENFPDYFTSSLVAYATPDAVVNSNNTVVPGAKGSFGTFAYGLNAWEDTICYNITVFVRGQYQSPAKTATHIHQAGPGLAGPPRLAFPNPVNSEGGLGEDLELRYSYGCLKGPFTTGVLANGVDTASGFTIKDLEANPSGFFTDTHTSEFVAGAVRGQLKKVKSDKKKHM